MSRIKTLSKIILITFFFKINLSGFSQTIINEDTISGTWLKTSSPYLIQGNVQIPEDSSLIINAGVEVIFQGEYNLVVNGYLEIEGAESDSVIFTAQDTTTGWRGIKLLGPVSDTIHFNYCIIEYVIASSSYPDSKYGALTIDSAILKLTHSRISNNKNGEYGCGLQATSSTLIIENNLFKNNNNGYAGGAVRSSGSYLYATNNQFIHNQSTIYYSKGGGINSEQDSILEIIDNRFIGNLTERAGGALLINDCQQVTLKNNKFLENECKTMGGAMCISSSTVEIVNNLICKNTAHRSTLYSSGGGGLKVEESKVRIINSTIADNDDFGIFSSSSSIQLINSIVSSSNNSSYPITIYVNDDGTDNTELFFDHCLIEDGLGTIDKPVYDTIIKDTINCIFDPPLFLDRDNNMFQVDFNSPIYNNGTFDTTGLLLSLTDLDENPRIIDDTIDIGAYEFNHSILNRVPKITSIPDYIVHIDTILEISVLFTDADTNDSHIITVYTNNPEINVQNLSGNSSGSTFTLNRSLADTDTITTVTIVVEDNSGANNAKDSIQFDVYYTNSYDFTTYQITHDMVWHTDTIKIFQQTTVNRDATLRIGAGTYISVQGNYKLNILGKLLAKGSENDTIYFTNQTNSSGSYWQGIYFPFDIHQVGESPPPVLSKIQYCKIRYAENGLYLKHLDSILVSNCDIGYCKRGIYCEGGATIKECNIHDNSGFTTGGGLYLNSYNLGPLYLLKCKIYNNEASEEGGGIRCGWDEIFLIGNQIYDNKSTSGGGIYVNGAATLLNNTITSNIAAEGGGVWQRVEDHIIYQNNIIQYNVASINGNQIYSYYSKDYIYFRNNYLEGGIDSIYVQAYSSEFNNKYMFYDQSDFTDTSIRDFSLIASSICINSGSFDTFLLKDIDQKILDELFIYDGRIDIGAIEFIGIPNNRLPILEKTDHLYLIPDSVATLTIDYFELDSDDNLDVQLYVSTPEITIQNLNLDETSISFDLVPNTSWLGSFDLIVHLKDESETIGRFNSDTIKIYVSNTHEYCGTYNEDVYWYADTILINCDVSIGRDAILYVGKGTKVKFTDAYSLTIKGLIKAEGAENDSILFTSIDTNWAGIVVNRFDNLSSLKGQYSYMKYCIIENTNSQLNGYSEAGLTIKREEFTLENSHIRNNVRTGVSAYYAIDDAPVIHGNKFTNNQYSALQITASPIVSNNIFEGNTSSTIKVIGGNPIISNNILRYNTDGAIELGGHGMDIQASIINNLIYSNTSNDNYKSAGIYCHHLEWNSKLFIVGNVIYDNHTLNCDGGGISFNYTRYEYVIINNNTIINNSAKEYGGGVFIGRDARAILNNNIIWGNLANGNKDQVGFGYICGQTFFNNCAVEDSLAGFKGWESGIENATFNKIWSVYPDFFNPDLNDYSLRNSSYYLDSGTVDTANMHLSAVDINGNPRIYNNTIDVGAFEFWCPDTMHSIFAEICHGEDYRGFTTAGTHYITEIASTGCDSIIEIQLLVNPIDTTIETKAICHGEDYRGFTTAGTHYITET
ncbi:right-handed parallel beta-helix repeat-containing protein, partial [Bacteroidota bacterium]